MSSTSGRRLQAGVAGCLFLAGVVGDAVIEGHPGVSVDWTLAVATGLSVTLGLLVVVRSPVSPAGPALMLLGAAPAATSALESWGGSVGQAGVAPGAQVVAQLLPAAWVFNLTGFVVLSASFPSGLLPGFRWRALPWTFLGVGVVGNLAVGLQPDWYQSRGGTLPGRPLFDLPAAPITAAVLVCAAALVGVLAMSVSSVMVRARTGDEVVRAQLRWFILGAGSVPVLLVGGWIAEVAFGASIVVAYTPFMLAMTVLLPLTVAVGVLRYDLLDIDRVLNGTIAGLLTTAGAAGVFAVVVTVTVMSGASRLRLGEPAALVAAAFATALVLQPLHRFLSGLVGRYVDHDRVVVLGGVRAFVDEVRDGAAQPEQVEAMLRQHLDDPHLQVLLTLPDTGSLVGLDGTPSTVDLEGGDDRLVILDWHARRIGALKLDRVSRRRVRRAREAALGCGHTIDVVRLRLELRQAADEARASRQRLVEAAAIERRRLERDLHDGAQQQILAVGMRLRSVQRRLPPDDPAAIDLDRAVGSLETIVAGLRRLAHGMRPAMLDDGLDVALGRLAAEVPLPVRLHVENTGLSEVAATTAYYVVAEAVANTLKHAHATAIDILVCGDGEQLRIEVSDDGLGGAVPGFGLTSLVDRVAAMGGQLRIHSAPGTGTTVEAVL